MAVATLLVDLFARDSAASAAKFLESKAVSVAQRVSLARLAGMETAWVECDQALPANVEDMAQSLVTELYEPFWFYRTSLRLDGPQEALPHRPRTDQQAAHSAALFVGNRTRRHHVTSSAGTSRPASSPRKAAFGRWEVG